MPRWVALLVLLSVPARALSAPSGTGASPTAPQLASEPILNADGRFAAEVESESQDDPGEAEAMSRGGLGTGVMPGLLYSTEISDAEIERRFVEDLESLGSISVGYAEAGRLINGVQLTNGDAWAAVGPPEYSWGTQETIDFLIAAARAVRERFPDAALLRVNHIGKRDGGFLRPHRSHQSGRDADLSFYYLPGVDPAHPRGRRDQLIDLAANWALVRSLATLTDVQVILVDRQVKKRLYDYALAQGENRVWLDSLFNAGAGSLLRHARGHRDHFHVRFYAARPQELGRRIQPFLAKRPEQNLVVHRVRAGETLGHIAMRYGSTVKLIQRANHLSGAMLRVGRGLTIPLRGPCTVCPVTPQVIVPPRRSPPPSDQALVRPSIKGVL